MTLTLVAFVGTQANSQIPRKKRQAEAPLIWSGNQLLDLCEGYKKEKLKADLGPGCFMYISGVTQTLVLTDDTETTMVSPCPRKGVTQEQIADVVIKWLDDHPEKRDLPAPAIISKSLNEAFPCN